MALRVAVAGLGPMGRGIARVFAESGASVTVVDLDAATTAAGHEKMLADGPVDVSTSDSVADAVRDADLFVEAIVERFEPKRALLAQVRAAGNDKLVVASNTSSLSIGELGVAYGDPTRVLGMHFFNPPTKMRLVEVIRGARTDPEIVARAREWVEGLGKTAVLCADSPNFVVNRVCRPLYYESQLLVTQGMTPAVVDAAVKSALGHRMGPLELLDFTGLHTHLGSSETALREFGDPRYRPIPLTRQLVRAGTTGRAAGRGYYDYSQGKPREAQVAVLREPRPSDARVQVYRAVGCTPEDVMAVRDLGKSGRVVVDSSDGAWREHLPPGAGWLRLHGGFAEVVADEVARIEPAYDAVDALGVTSVPVLALPGLVVDRLAHTMANEALTVVEEGTAGAGDVDLALRLGMNHPVGPLEYLASVGARDVLTSLRGMLDGFGDPRYRPAQLLVRQAAGSRG
ncbi:3-hydroxyacyl-CoA dehydrogenase [Actinophytocola oryzae]|uniref:3-hydroxyacyl-CoA dehydrogenase n=1 Tax=Actinophytocola oryzae TaxID=502181 RepID=A0A4R7W4S6_9PSEU|nr:3-hydroxyacyl-CoA dehydrogenase NAD-binding domain-containing protein [Actinophytocola oryzae]TDV57542.1 3-hydroxyacyl-CoA dehydrogenase [Actinophytocola oryzae]